MLPRLNSRAWACVVQRKTIVFCFVLDLELIKPTADGVWLICCNVTAHVLDLMSRIECRNINLGKILCFNLDIRRGSIAYSTI